MTLVVPGPFMLTNEELNSAGPSSTGQVTQITNESFRKTLLLWSELDFLTGNRPNNTTNWMETVVAVSSPTGTWKVRAPFVKPMAHAATNAMHVEPPMRRLNCGIQFRK